MDCNRHLGVPVHVHRERWPCRVQGHVCVILWWLFRKYDSQTPNRYFFDSYDSFAAKLQRCLLELTQTLVGIWEVQLEILVLLQRSIFKTITASFYHCGQWGNEIYQSIFMYAGYVWPPMLQGHLESTGTFVFNKMDRDLELWIGIYRVSLSFKNSNSFWG